MGVGPTLVGAFTDFLMRDEAQLGLPITLLLAVVEPAWALALCLGLPSMRSAVAEAGAWRSAVPAPGWPGVVPSTHGRRLKHVRVRARQFLPHC